MTADQAIVVAVLGSSLVLFATGRPRYDVVALLALLAVTLTGVVPADRAFQGFGHPAVVTVAAVLVIGRALQNSGLVDVLARPLARVGKGVVAQVAALSAATALASTVMNNIGALALVLPVALRLTRESGTPPSLVLMPIAFASLLGGLTTLIGTPPNIIVSSFREAHAGRPFAFFDFAPVGGAVAVAGLAFLALAGWRLLPRRRPAEGEDWFQIESYLTELRVPAGSKLVGKRLLDLRGLADVEFLVVGIVRDGERRAAPAGHETIHAGDKLLAEVDPKGLERLVAATGVELGGAGGREALGSDDVAVVEAVVTPGSALAGESARTIRLRERHGVNLVALAREGDPVRRELKDAHFRAGDVLLLQGAREGLPATLARLGCLPLAERDLRIGRRRPRLLLGVGVFGAAIVLTSLGLVPAHVSFTAAGVAMLLARLLTLTEAYDAVDWPILILLGGMLPVGEALETSGAAKVVAAAVLGMSNELPVAAVLAILLFVTMSLTDVINNAAAAVIMAPIAIAVADGLGVSIDPFLMAISIGASCAFLTPIGHQSNTLVLGPGGYHFGDYWKMGLPLEIVILLLAVPLLLLVWPL